MLDCFTQSTEVHFGWRPLTTAANNHFSRVRCLLFHSLYSEINRFVHKICIFALTAGFYFRAAKEGLELTLMERLLKLCPGDLIVRMLTTQYRMHEDIMKWPSDQLYESKLKAHHSVKSHLLRLIYSARVLLI